MSDAKITIREHGALRVDGDVPLYDHEGNQLIVPTEKPYALCRCGGSSRKPFCDGSHKTNGFDGRLAQE